MAPSDVVSNGIPSSVWTNTAQHPSDLLNRDPQVARDMLTQLGVPSCARTDAMNFLFVQKSPLKYMPAEVLTVTSEAASTATGTVFSPLMHMTFRKNGQDLTQVVHLAEHKVATGYTQTFSCGGQRIHLAYFESCGNLARLEEWESYHHWYYRDFDQCQTNTVPEPSSAALLVLGLVAASLMKRGRSRLKLSRR